MFSTGRAGRGFSLATSIRFRLGVEKGEGDESAITADYSDGRVRGYWSDLTVHSGSFGGSKMSGFDVGKRRNRKGTGEKERTTVTS